eukprot:5561533-Pleurochrysis_carterae.AAC.1
MPAAVAVRRRGRADERDRYRALFILKSEDRPAHYQNDGQLGLLIGLAWYVQSNIWHRVLTLSLF